MSSGHTGEPIRLDLLHLAWKNAIGNAFRSLAILVCAALVASLALTATFVVRGAEAGLRANLERLGADILALPWGTMTEKIGGVRIMSAAVEGWMPRSALDDVAALEGVARVTPQLYLGTVEDHPGSPLANVWLVAYEPATDFVLEPWLAREGQIVGVGEALAGAEVQLLDDSYIAVHGQRLHVVGKLTRTKTTIDNTVFVTFETAAQLAKTSDRGLKLRPEAISAVMVRTTLGSDPHEVALRILEQTSGVVPLETPGLFQSERRQMIGVLRTVLGLLVVIWGLTIAFVGLIFSIAVNERRCEIGVLRAVGFSRLFVLKSLLAEGATLALVGGLLGVLLTALGYGVWGEQAMTLTKVPLLLPSPLGWVSLSIASQTIALFSVTVAVFLPAWGISHQEVAITMRR